MVGPVGEVFRRKYMVVGHAEPVLSLSLGCGNVVRGIDIDPVIENSGRGVGTELAADDGILGCQHHGRQQQHRYGCLSHFNELLM